MQMLEDQSPVSEQKEKENRTSEKKKKVIYSLQRKKL